MSSLRAWLLHPVLERIDRMSESTTAAIADLAALEVKQAADIAQLKTDVTAALAVIASAGSLNAAQQDALNSLKAAMTADDATITGIDAAITGATTPAAPATPPATPPATT